MRNSAAGGRDDIANNGKSQETGRDGDPDQQHHGHDTTQVP